MLNILPRAIAASALVSSMIAAAQAASPPFAIPQFHFVDTDASDYRPTVNVEGTRVIFERTLDNVTKLHIGNLQTGAVNPFATIPSQRADWCWNRSVAGQLVSGPVAFSNEQGVWRHDIGATRAKLLGDTAGMIYPAWYPNCRFLAVDVASANVQIPGSQNLTARINASTGKVVAAPLANDLVWAGFASVNQVDPRIIAFAGQFKGGGAYYNQDLNYTWVVRPSGAASGMIAPPPPVAPFDRNAPAGSGFLSQFQARAGWWSPDGKWFAFESNRSCVNVEGTTYALFIQDAAGASPPMQVTSCAFNAQHAKWLANGTTLIAAVAQLPETKFHIATFDVTAFVQGNK